MWAAAQDPLPTGRGEWCVCVYVSAAVGGVYGGRGSLGPLGLCVSPCGVSVSHMDAGRCRWGACKGGGPQPTPPPPGRMDPFVDTLQRLRETFSTGRTRPAEFRAAQLRGLDRFLQDNRQLLQEALAQDLGKVGWEAGRAGWQRQLEGATNSPSSLLPSLRPNPTFCIRPFIHFLVHLITTY